MNKDKQYYSNYHCKIDNCGYYLECPQYYDILCKLCYKSIYNQLLYFIQYRFKIVTKLIIVIK